jgi:hypothetical protein
MFLKYFIIYTLISFSIAIEPKLCVNCKHFIKNKISPKFSKCALFDIIKFRLFDEMDNKINNMNYLVTGIEKENKNLKNYFPCSIARNCEFMCGINGKKYEPKDKEDTKDNEPDDNLDPDLPSSCPIQPIIPIDSSSYDTLKCNAKRHFISSRV